MTIPSSPQWWQAKFHDLPLLTVASTHFPVYDGDMALLDELADMVLTYPRCEVARLRHRDMWHATEYALDIHPRQILRGMP